MASRYHWLTGGISTGWNSTTNTGIRTLVVPANATLKKSVLHNSGVFGLQTGIGWPQQQAMCVNATLQLVGGGYGTRNIYSRRNALQLSLTGFYDTQTFQRVYSGVYSGGDNEMGHNLQTSYGGPGKGAITLNLSWYVGPYGAVPVACSGQIMFSWDVLYYL